MGFLGDLLSKTPIVGDVVGGFINAGAQRDTNAQQISLSRENTELARRDAASAHQTEVKDLMAAGLNPNLSAGGNGASVQQGSTPGLTAPQIQFPNLMSAFKDIQDLELRSRASDQQDRALDIQDKNVSAGIAKNLSEVDMNKFKKVLLQKGMIRADLEGEASDVLKKGIKYLKELYNKSTINPKEMDMYEGAIPKNTQNGSIMGLP